MTHWKRISDDSWVMRKRDVLKLCALCVIAGMTIGVGILALTWR